MNDDTDDHDGDRGPLERLRELLERLDSLESLEGSGELGEDDFTVEYGFDARTGLGPGSPSRRGHPRFGSSGGSGSRGTDATDAADAADDDPLVATREIDGGTHVVADLQGRDVDPDAVDASVVDGTLIVADDGATLLEAPVEDGDVVTESRFHNGVLELRITSDGSGDGDGDGRSEESE